MSSSLSLTQTAPVILVVLGILIGSPLAIASLQQAGLTQEEQEKADRMYSVQGLTTQYLEAGDKRIGGLIFTPRWGDVVFVDPATVSVIFADCLPGEFAVSSEQILGGSDLNVLESYGIAMPNDFMMWLMVVENLNETDKLPASAGVICVSDRDIDTENSASTTILRPEYKQQINNIIKQFIKVENNQVVNLQQIINIRQEITQIAIQIALGGGNVTQIINQTASQIVASNGTNISQIIGQAANQTVGANATNVNQTIGQAANQTVGGPAPDTTPPVLTVPEDMAVEATSEDGATVPFAVSALDNVDGPVEVSCNHNSGETFPTGDTDVECSATDVAGNTGTESFTITVTEGEDSTASGNNTDA